MTSRAPLNGEVGRDGGGLKGETEPLGWVDKLNETDILAHIAP